MGLAISVGVLAGGPDGDPEGVASDRKAFRQINQLLAKAGLPLHHEPETLPDFPFRGHCPSFPYAWTPYLYRAIAYARRAPQEFRPVAKGEDPYKDKYVDAELYTFAESHIICHSDTEGYFVPIDFEDILVDKRKGGLVGRNLGSSQRALAELMKTAPLLGIRLTERQLSDEDAWAISKEPDESNPYWIERKVWLTMFEAFRLSVEHKCAVVYG